ncbi:hypothetical protein HZH68_009335 [Vespula germanica]|uniref:Uncharacterized protein n=1 Tax=Vespula germanica TaxID=30212 RepID=A0A834N4A7_VESGE|nr:hypothetical protein HZH68_009335 [Vespula germanica]
MREKRSQEKVGKEGKEEEVEEDEEEDEDEEEEEEEEEEASERASEQKGPLSEATVRTRRGLASHTLLPLERRR